MNTRPTPETDAETMRDEWDHVDSDFGPFGPSDSVPADFARKLERERDEAREQRDRLLEEREQWRLSSVCRELVEQRDRLADALRKLADCDWVITPHDRMDAVREIARKALQSLTPNETISK